MTHSFPAPFLLPLAALAARTTAEAPTPPLATLAFGATREVPLPWLAGNAIESWPGSGGERRPLAGFAPRRSAALSWSTRAWADERLLFASIEADLTGRDAFLEDDAEAVYAALLTAAAEAGFSQDLRFWNFLDRVNDAPNGPDDERYRRFSIGRARALTARDPDFEAGLPAATAIGLPAPTDARLVVQLLAARPGVVATRLENPRQLSAWRYPRQYGPQSPSFARATRLGLAGGAERLLVSGTASIVGHETRHTDDALAQFTETQRNIASLIDAWRAESGLGPAAGLRAESWRVYLRHAADLAVVTPAAAHLPGGPAPVAWLTGDICRTELLVEVEGVLTLSPPTTSEITTGAEATS